LGIDLAKEFQLLDVGMVLRHWPMTWPSGTLSVAKQRSRANTLVVGGMLGRRHTKAHDVFEFLGELRVARDFEASLDVRL
jgi:hypothetical protein